MREVRHPQCAPQRLPRHEHAVVEVPVDQHHRVAVRPSPRVRVHPLFVVEFIDYSLRRQADVHRIEVADACQPRMIPAAVLHLGSGFHVLETLTGLGHLRQQAVHAVLAGRLLGDLDGVRAHGSRVLLLDAYVRVGAPPAELMLDDGQRGPIINTRVIIDEVARQGLVASAVGPDHERGRLDRLGLLLALFGRARPERAAAQLVAHAVDVGAGVVHVAHGRAVPLPAECPAERRRGPRPRIRVPWRLAAPAAEHSHLALHEEPDLVGRIEVFGIGRVRLTAHVVVPILAQDGELLAPSLAARVWAAGFWVDHEVAAPAHVVRLAVDEEMLSFVR